MLRCILLAGVLLASSLAPSVQAQPHSVARQWNDVLLEAIRDDLARPVVHARNLFHVSAAMYDAWAAFDPVASPYLLGRQLKGFGCPYDPPALPSDLAAARREAVSYAAYTLLVHRFVTSPGAWRSVPRMDDLLAELGYDRFQLSVDYRTGDPAALGNYIANCYIEFGLADGANEVADYRNLAYQPVNEALDPTLEGNPTLADPNRWQPLAFDLFVDQAGNPLPATVPEFLGPEWGGVVPFALTDDDKTAFERDGVSYTVYHDPGPPPLLGDGIGLEDDYVWMFALVGLWSGHLDPADGVEWDVSPAVRGNRRVMPATLEGMRDYYGFLDGSTPSLGHTVNPHTGQPYEPNIVLRGDYARVLAEFWADGPDSETPPGHWFTILNYVNDHPEFERRYRGLGAEVPALEWDIKAYLLMGGAMHDAAVAAWSVKGWYDYIRPISAFRAMAERGQCTDPSKANYDPAGLPLIPGRIEVIEAGDPLAGPQNKRAGGLKLWGWNGPEAIGNPEIDVAGVSWMLPETWWPYQRPTFVTPPFAGYVSGHSTYSRAAAEVLTLLTGDTYFPGGMGEFVAEKNEFLVFEEGPSETVTLQWATYQDAADESGLSRIWGGIHPPVDDMPGRLIGLEIGRDAFALAERYFNGQIDDPAENPLQPIAVYPNPARRGEALRIRLDPSQSTGTLHVFDTLGRRVASREFRNAFSLRLATDDLVPGTYFVRLSGEGIDRIESITVVP
ncbi:MAG: DUF6851 domain-containing protein [Bacteroidota bacterium]